MRRAALLFFAASLLLPGQSLPSLHRKKPADSTGDKAITFAFAGIVRKMDDKSLDLEAVDTRFINFLISTDSKLPTGLKEGDPIRIDATQDDKGFYHAVSAKVDKTILQQMPKESPTAQLNDSNSDDPPERPSTTVVKDTPQYDKSDDGPPVLKHGKPAQRASRDDDADSGSAAPAGSNNDSGLAAKAAARNAAMEAPSAPPLRVDPSEPGADLLQRANEAAANFLTGLPNYICTQVTTRYQSETKTPNWQAIDNISAELVYENGKESYRNLQINGKATKKSPEETGAWSYGEFGTILADLFSPATAADFHFVRDTSVNRLKSSSYDFQVDRPHSHWKIAVLGQFLLPAYQGSVSIEKATGHVLRIEMQAKEIPKQFPEDVVETTVDYDYVSLGTGDKYLLPTHAELLSCERGSYRCQRNTIDFRNYHKFTGESTIKFNQ